MFPCFLENHWICKANHQADDVCELRGEARIKALIATPDRPSGLTDLGKTFQDLDDRR